MSASSRHSSNNISKHRNKGSQKNLHHEHVSLRTGELVLGKSTTLFWVPSCNRPRGIPCGIPRSVPGALPNLQKAQAFPARGKLRVARSQPPAPLRAERRKKRAGKKARERREGCVSLRRTLVMHPASAFPPAKQKLLSILVHNVQ